MSGFAIPLSRRSARFDMQASVGRRRCSVRLLVHMSLNRGHGEFEDVTGG